jgi:hypothetical protein
MLNCWPATVSMPSSSGFRRKVIAERYVAQL